AGGPPQEAGRGRGSGLRAPGRGAGGAGGAAGRPARGPAARLLRRLHPAGGRGPGRGAVRYREDEDGGRDAQDERGVAGRRSRGAAAVDTPMSHSEFEELAAGYVLGALEPDDEHAFQRHLEGCPTCQANLRELEAVVGELAYTVPPVDPPDTVWAGIRRQIKPEAARPGAVQVPPPAGAPRAPEGSGAPGSAPGGRGLRLLPVLAAAAAILVVVVLSLWNLNLRDENAVYRDH